MPLVFTENEVTVARIDYEDRTGVSYQYPARYRHMVKPGELFVYYRGRRTRRGTRVPQVYFGAGVVGDTARDLRTADRYTCQILDYSPFANVVPFKDASGNYFETGGQRRGFFQPGVRRIAESDFRRIISANDQASAPIEVNHQFSANSAGSLPRYASPEVNRAIEAFALRAAIDEVHRRFPGCLVTPQARNNPGFDVLVKRAPTDSEIYIEVKGTTRQVPQFFITEGELQFSRAHGDAYRLLVVFGIDIENDCCQVMWRDGAITAETVYRLTPVQLACDVTVQPVDAASRP